jgi:hypothetical protein
MKYQLKTCLLLITFLTGSCLLIVEDDPITHIFPHPDETKKSYLWYASDYNQPFYPAKDTIKISSYLSFFLNPRADIYLPINVDFKILIDGNIFIDGGFPVFPIFRKFPYSYHENTLADGIYKMTVIQHVPSGTGSLADKLEAEYVTHSKDYTLIIDD